MKSPSSLHVHLNTFAQYAHFKFLKGIFFGKGGRMPATSVSFLEKAGGGAFFLESAASCLKDSEYKLCFFAATTK